MHHRLPYRQLLGRDEALREMLASIALPKFIFTNADRKHAAICLELLGIADLFEVRGFAGWLLSCCCLKHIARKQLFVRQNCRLYCERLCGVPSHATPQLAPGMSGCVTIFWADLCESHRDCQQPTCLRMRYMQ